MRHAGDGVTPRMFAISACVRCETAPVCGYFPAGVGGRFDRVLFLRHGSIGRNRSAWTSFSLNSTGSTDAEACERERLVNEHVVDLRGGTYSKT